MSNSSSSEQIIIHNFNKHDPNKYAIEILSSCQSSVSHRMAIISY